MKIRDTKINRSEFYYLISPIEPADRMPKAKSDTLGSALTIGILLAAVSLVRMLFC